MALERQILQFATATLNGDGTYTLTNLLRGRFGTEQYVGTHASNRTFVFLDANVMQTVEYPASDIGATRYWRASTTMRRPIRQAQRKPW